MQQSITEKNYFEVLNGINVKDKTETKGKFNYLSWAWAWGELKKVHPTATYKVYETLEGCIYFTDSRTAWVKVGVTVNELEHIEYLPIMDFQNKSMPLDKITSFDANKSIQRALTKAIARHGLGLYIYAGEDLPENPDNVVQLSSKNSNDIDILSEIENLTSFADFSNFNEKYKNEVANKGAFNKAMAEQRKKIGGYANASN